MKISPARRHTSVPRDSITRKWDYRDMERKEKLNLRKLKSLTSEFDALTDKFRGGAPKCVRNRLSRLEDVIEVKTAIYEEALKNA
tara:strand:+ start:381 stop:635 length:255 start_codon:yes stop_codon:yes gene_type:complete